MHKLSFILAVALLLSGCSTIPRSLTQLDVSHQQALIVQTNAKYRSAARLTLWHRENGGWHVEYPTVSAIVGRSGLAIKGNKKEGDGYTPQGAYGLGMAFGYAPSFTTGLEYRQVTADDLWVDDEKSPQYNTWVKAPAQAASFEKLRREDALYKMAVVIEYNTHPIVPGAGSAIFMHIWRRYDHPTAGCVALSERHLRRILRHLDKKRNPVIILRRIMDDNFKQQLPQLLSAISATTGSGGINWPNLMGGIVFGTIGMVAFMYGKKEKSAKPLGIGIALMAYPYFISNSIVLYLIGIALTAALFFWKD